MFERIDFGKRKVWWGVFRADDYTPEPLAIFRTEPEATRYLDWLANGLPEGEQVNVDMAVAEIVGLREANEEAPRIQVWNSVEPMPVDSDEEPS